MDDVLTFIDGGSIDLRVLDTDPVTGVIHTVDGGKIFADGSMQRADGALVLPSGDIVYMNGTLRTVDGTLVQGASSDPGVLDTILQAVQTGGQIAQSVMGLVNTVSGSGAILQTGGYAVLSGNRVQLPDGSVVQATVRPDGRLQLPDGRVLGAATAGLFSGGGLLMVGAAGIVLVLLLSRRRR